MPGLYVHVPFCVRKCLYCDFFSIDAAEAREGNMVVRFLDAFSLELQRLPGDFVPDTVYIGGGTPTALDEPELKRLLDLVRTCADVTQVTEWTCEANPGTVTPGKAEVLRKAGVTRVSLGVQSFHDENLEFLGRIHNAEEAVATFRVLRDVGFDNINLDLMFGIPRSPRSWLQADLAAAIELAPEHIAYYNLTIEGCTPLARMRGDGLVHGVGEVEELEQYRLVKKTLEEAGYEHYEISNYARPGRQCRHNLLYWGPGEYIGCGPAAHSHWQGTRYANLKAVREYCASMQSGRKARASEEKLEPEAKAREALVMGLRRLAGVSRETFRKETGFDYRDLKGSEIDWLCKGGFLEEQNDTLRLTEKGLYVSNSVFAELV